MSIRFADISEFQSDFNADAYLGGGYHVIICRVYNGYRKDNMMPGRMTYIRGKNFASVGWYFYLAKDRDAATQAREFCALVGKMAPNEFLIVDHEEGSGNQTVRCESALQVCDQHQGFKSTLYAGQSFLQTNLSGVQHWGDRPLWIAKYLNSYQPTMSSYPQGAEFWQYSDRERFPGLAGGVDASIFDGTEAEFSRIVRRGAPSVTAPPQVTYYNVYKGGVVVAQIAVMQNKDGRIEVFVLKDDGTVMHKWQSEPNKAFVANWSSLGKP